MTTTNMWHWLRWGRGSLGWLGCGMIAMVCAACAPSSLVDVAPPSTVIDPGTVASVSGAIALRAGALAQMMYALGGDAGENGNGVIGQSGMLTDELENGSFAGAYQTEDERRLDSTGTGFSYNDIQAARVKARIARESLLAYAANSSLATPAWQGELYALEGYSIVWLAELYCSGIPLTSVSLSGAATPTGGFSTQDLLTHAVALFDSAEVLSGDSANFVNLARVGKGRALLGLGRFADADAAVADVPTDFVYRLRSDSNGTSQGANNIPTLVGSYYVWRAQDHEGQNGLVWSTDPRTGVVVLPAVSTEFLWPSKYNINPDGQFDPMTPYLGVPVRLADGLEARLIQAEAALSRGDASWLTTLNMLRSTCVGTAACAPVPGLTSTSLPPLTDPGSAEARLDTLMKERAMWLYLTGHREGDFRRLARVYHRDSETVWPIGTVVSPAIPDLGMDGSENGKPYGHSTVYLPDPAEQQNNPLYGGCFDTNP